ncbi:SRPBCC family protein [Flavobacterium sp. RHBU_3]|uniref:SRPBCC family protein n=1 Tax=Flavobacterium sp. RHBU_3 TaxID=3391184 RepID=UPI0039846424
METKALVTERVYNVPVQKVWEAITVNDKMKDWYFQLDEFKAEVGFRFHFTGGSEEKQYLHLCEITEVIPQRKLAYSWKYDGYEGESFVVWELFPDGEGTKLVLTHVGLETFPLLKDFARESFTEGWKYILGISLQEFLEK